MTIDLFISCVMDQFYPETAKNVVKILDAASIDVYYNPEQTCCGRYAFTSGFVDEAKEIGEKFIKDFPNDSLYTNTFNLSAPLINAVRSGNNVILSTVTPIRSEWVGDRYYGNDDIDEHRSSLFYVWYDYKDDPTRWVADLDLTLTSSMFAGRANY